eukprot:12881376-Prorocentrum_lima.AAC.1
MEGGTAWRTPPYAELHTEQLHVTRRGGCGATLNSSRAKGRRWRWQVGSAPRHRGPEANSWPSALQKWLT